METTEAAFSFGKSPRSTRFGAAGCIFDNDQQHGSSPVAQKVGRDIWAPLSIPLCHLPGLSTVSPSLDTLSVILDTTSLPGERD